MFIFTINATDAFGGKKKIEIKAVNPNEAILILKNEGFRAGLDDIVNVRKDSFWAKLQQIDFSGRFSRVPKKDIFRLVKMIGNSLKKGRTLKESLGFIGENEDSKALKRLIDTLRQEWKSHL